MDLEDFLTLKNQLCIKLLSKTKTFCFKSKALAEMEKVPHILDVEVTLNGDYGFFFFFHVVDVNDVN